MFFEPTTLYLMASTLLAILLLVESAIVRKHNGRFLGNRLLSFISIFKLIGFIVSATVLFKLQFQSWTVVVPLVFVVFNMVALLYSFYVFRDSNMLENVTTDAKPDDILLPTAYTDFLFAFALAFFGITVASLGYELMQHTQLMTK